MRAIIVSSAVAMALCVGGVANATQKGVLAGAGAGAVSGAVVAGPVGAVVGAGVGAVAGHEITKHPRRFHHHPLHHAT